MFENIYIDNQKKHIKGDTFQGIDITLDTVTPVDLTDAEISVIFSFGSIKGKEEETLTIGSGIEVVDLLNGKIKILGDRIINWNVGTYYFTVKVTFPDNTIKTYLQDTLQVVDSLGNVGECCDYKIIYCDCPYAVVPCDKFILRQNYNNQKISFYICMKTGNWGDQAILDLTNYDITVNLLDKTDTLYLSKSADWSSVTKKCTLSFDSFDLKDKGSYYVELDIQHQTEDLGWQIPDKHKRIDLEIK